MDFRLLEEIPYEEVTERINAALPLDIRIIETTVPVCKNTDIASAEWEITADIDKEKFLDFCNSEKIITEKKTKKGISEIDLKPCILALDVSDKITLRLPAGNNFNINPQLLLDAYKRQRGAEIPIRRIVRMKLFCEDGSEFR